MDELYFFDSYALFEIIKGNKNYIEYTNADLILSKLNIFELYYGLLRETDEKTAFSMLNKYYNFIIDFDKEIIEQAAKFRFLYKKSKFSMADCIGYMIAKRLGVKFLTGDKEFESMPNVEFVK